ncbi:glycerol transporter [Phlyctochytrium planicorne]|nr:glycerol transporter [Phlyctochytrium planicorne]
MLKTTHSNETTIPVTHPSKPITQHPSKSSSQSPPSPRWLTPEFLLYYLTCIFITVWMFRVALEMGTNGSPVYIHYYKLLTRGWLYRRPMDDSDVQYSKFREQLPTLMKVAASHIITMRVIRAILARRHKPRKAFLYSTLFSFIFSIAVLGVLHGMGAIKILVLLVIPYALTKSGAGISFRLTGIGSVPAVPMTIWLYAIAILLLNSRYNGYEFGWIHSSLAILDNYKGLLPRWYLTFNFQILRIISFSMDHHWSLQSTDQTLTELNPKKDDNIRSTTYSPSQSRITAPRPEEDYNLITYLDYCLYLPLSFAGPIITFNDFVAQSSLKPSRTIKNPYPTIPTKTFLYFIRWSLCLFLMESLQHLLHIPAMAKNKVWLKTPLTPFQFMIIGYFSLVFIWLKVGMPKPKHSN